VEQQSPESPGIARGLNAVHILPADWTAAPLALATVIDRVDRDLAVTQLLVVVANADAAIAVTQAISAARGGTGPRVVAATGASRVARVLRAGAAPILVGPPEELLALLRASALKLETVRTLVVAWVEEILASESAEDLEAVLAEVPKDAARIVITAALDAPVEDFIERHARRAPRLHLPGEAKPAPHRDAAASAPAVPPTPTAGAIPVGYVLVSRSGRLLALRRVLDELDPPSAAIYVRSEQGEREVRDTLSALGYDGPNAPIRAVQGAPSEHTTLLVLYDLPQLTSEWRAATSGHPARVVALMPPRLLGQLRALAGASVAPLSFAAPLDAARASMARLRAELRRELATGTPAHELLALEPLLEEFDGVALAAASLRLLAHERAARARLEAAQPTAAVKDTPVRPPERPSAGGPRHRDDRGTRAPGAGAARRDGPSGGQHPRGHSPDHGPGARPLPRRPR